ncbi:RelA/SpoT domain-containing protein [Kistimonas scapharcae]|uniref:RelA/SpoT domain-containing protein n=1 Tax=Kistimonas scapharcae TaxID=1036133 RepID=A0ABP8V8D4_9GAMM
MELLRSQVGDDGYYESMKMEPSVRTKTLDSLINKAFVRKKGKYQDPYADITDKVGIRFVVLLTRDINVLQGIVESHPDWEYSLDRDFQQEKDKDPRLFDYQSMHYVVRAKRDIDLHSATGDLQVSEGTPCEIQIRTLLQHAYAEVTHDTLYKGNVTADALVHRTIAKSMALMETTDDLLVKAKELLAGPGQQLESWETVLKDRFKQIISGQDVCYEYDVKSMSFVLDALQELLSKETPEKFQEFWDNPENKYMESQIIDHWNDDTLYRQPTITLLYYLANRRRHLLPKVWPLPHDSLNGIYRDLGLAPTW